MDKVYLPTMESCKVIDDAYDPDLDKIMWLIQYSSGKEEWVGCENVEDMDIVKDKGLNLEFYGDY